jgi:23S rRNA (adenine1618-N6)-methyltransferase
MLPKKKEHQKIKSRLHPRSKHRERYDFKKLIKSCPELAQYVGKNKYNDESIDFADPEAVKMLNQALLKHFYQIDHWDIPENYLCPPIPGRADYIHHIADLLATYNDGKVPKNIKCLDIGVGANCIYPIIGHREYGWSFIGSDIDPIAIAAANKTIAANDLLKGAIEVRLQPNPKDIFKGIIKENELIDLTISNPPFHASAEEAQALSLRKSNNLSGNKNANPILNFGGQSHELWYEGGEKIFVKNMIDQSKQFANSCYWFSTLISKQSNLDRVYKQLEYADAVEIKTLPMGQGNKFSRVVAWTFLSKTEQEKWVNTRWK